MKYPVVLGFLLLLSVSGKGQEASCQNQCDLYFEELTDFCPLGGLTIDTVLNPNNLWSIGNPEKSVFMDGYNSSNALVTDLVQPYPVNDTSSFVFAYSTEGGGFFGGWVILSAYFQVNTDSLNDYGALHFSPDNGISWIDLLNDTVYDASINWTTEKPTFTGNSDGWKNFQVFIQDLGDELDISFGDTVQFKFTFISDSIDDGLDGLMFDQLFYQDCPTGIEDILPFKSSVYPNPASEFIVFEFHNPHMLDFELIVRDAQGRLAREITLNTNSREVDIKKLQDGLYFYHLYNLQRQLGSSGKFIVRKD